MGNTWSKNFNHLAMQKRKSQANKLNHSKQGENNENKWERDENNPFKVFRMNVTK